MKSPDPVRGVTSATQGPDHAQDARVRSEDALDSEVARLCLALMEVTRQHVFETFAALDLTVAQGKALHRLERPTRMRDLADELGFDASYITAVIDRLEERGLVQRASDPRDRRVKVLVATEEGHRVRRQVEHEVFGHHPALAHLTAHERRQLRDLLATAQRRHDEAESAGDGPAAESDR